MAPPTPRLGVHLPLGNGLLKAADRAGKIGADTVQVFVDNPTAWRRRAAPPKKLSEFRERVGTLGIRPVAVHAAYLVNLAAPDKEIHKKSRAALRDTTEVACAIDADGVVFHVGSHLGAGLEAGMKRCVPAIKEALELCTDTTWLLMEDSAGAGGTIGRSLEELAQLLDACDGHERLGVCLDTCHLFVSGVDITKRVVVDELLEELDERIGLDRLRALHVNDARDPLGSNRDRHANIGEGVIGSKLGVFLSHPKLQGLPAFLEVPGADDHGPDANELKKVRRLHKRWCRTTAG